MHTYAVSVVIEGSRYNYHVPNKDGVRELIASATAQIQLVEMWEETHINYSTEFRKMERAEVAALCDEAQFAVLAHA